jgi:glycosyltransferase involved in cell wall biosynthesis
LGFPSLIIAISGMGSLFIENKKKLQIKKIYYFLYKYLLKIIFNYKNKTIIVQNNDDKNFILSFKNVLKENIVLIQGSGVDLKLFSEINLEAKEKIVLFPARILKDKGALEFVNAARILKHKFPEWKFIMAGASDYANPSKISTQTIQQWVMDGVIDWLGHKEEMVDIYKKSSVVCLPSYREGMPKSLLEAAAAGCAVITTNAIGCKDAIIPNITGILVPVCDVSSTVLALDKVMRDDKLRKEFGRAGIVLAAKSFSLESVVCKTINAYNHSTIINNMHSDHK